MYRTNSLTRTSVILVPFINAGFAIFNYLNPAIQATTYVLTPMVDILPEGPPLSKEEQDNLLGELRHQPEARDMQNAYSRMGATLSLHDLLRGVGGLEKSQCKLSTRQTKRIEKLLVRAQETHSQLRDTQRDILDKERALADQLVDLQAVDGGHEME